MLHLSEVRIAIVGWVFSGKSASANTLLSRDEFPTSCRTKESQTRTGEIGKIGKQILVTDTPGWFKYFPVQYTASQVTSEIKKAVTFGTKRPHAILLVVPLSVSFLEEQRKIMRDNMERLGENVWRHTIVLFTWGDMLEGMSVEEHIESEGEPLRWLLEKCGNRYHVLNNNNREDQLQVTTLLDTIENMVTENHMFTPSVKKLHEEPQADSDLKGFNCGHEVNIVDSLHALEKQWQRDDEEMKEFVQTECNTGSFVFDPPNCESSFYVCVHYLHRLVYDFIFSKIDSSDP